MTFSALKAPLRLVAAHPSPTRLSEGNINYMRAFAALAVFMHHSYDYLAFNTPLFGWAGGVLGVYAFFVISGYLILRSADRRPIGEYVRHRFFRIYPPYIVVYLSIGGVIGALTWSKVREAPLLFASYLTLTGFLFPAGFLRYNALCGIEWTLTLEALWYALAPLVLIGMRRAWRLVTMAGLALSFGWYWLGRHGKFDSLYGAPEQLAALHPYFREFYIQNAFQASLGYFLLGATVYRLRRWLTLPWCLLAPMAGLTLVYSLSMRQAGVNPIFPTGVGMAALLLLLLRLPPIPLRLVDWLSDISYSLYLTHAVLLYWIGWRLNWKGAGAFAVALPLSLTIATILYILLEQPAMRYARTRNWLQSLPTPRQTLLGWLGRSATNLQALKPG